MVNKKYLLFGSITFLVVICTILAVNGFIKADKNLNIYPKSIEDDSGCCSVILNINHGHDVVSYRRDSNYSADIIIYETNFAGQNAVKQYKTQDGYFSHVIITQNGWIIGTGGRDNPNTTKLLEILGSSIISKGKIEKIDINKANSIIKANSWGHFIIKSPTDDVGVTAYDSRVSSNMTEVLRMKPGDYIKVPNNPKYYGYGYFNTVSNDPTDAAIKIAGTDPYGQVRKDITTFDYNNESGNIDVWASFDGGAFVQSIKECPDSIIFMGNKTEGSQLPVIPSKENLGEIKFNDNLNYSSELSSQISSNSFWDDILELNPNT